MRAKALFGGAINRKEREERKDGKGMGNGAKQAFGSMIVGEREGNDGLRSRRDDCRWGADASGFRPLRRVRWFSQGLC